MRGYQGITCNIKQHMAKECPLWPLTIGRAETTSDDWRGSKSCDSNGATAKSQKSAHSIFSCYCWWNQNYWLTWLVNGITKHLFEKSGFLQWRKKSMDNGVKYLFNNFIANTNHIASTEKESYFQIWSQSNCTLQHLSLWSMKWNHEDDKQVTERLNQFPDFLGWL